MKIIVTKDYNDMSRKAANIISAQIITKPNCVLGLGQDQRLADWLQLLKDAGNTLIPVLFTIIRIMIRISVLSSGKILNY